MKNFTARSIAVAIVAVAAVMVAGLGYMRLCRRALPHIDVDRERYPVAGIDISAHNGVVDFDSLAAARIDFVFVKASEGTAFRDAAFLRNYAAARRTDITVGAYHFFRFDCDGRRQAVNFMAALGGVLPDLPLAIDVEEFGNPAQVSTATVVARLEAMVAELRAAGYKVLIYTNKNGYWRFVHKHFDNVLRDDPEVWICSFSDPPLPKREWRLWQHSHKARVPGVKGDVDMNTFNGTREQWHRWLDSVRPDTIIGLVPRY